MFSYMLSYQNCNYYNCKIFTIIMSLKHSKYISDRLHKN